MSNDGLAVASDKTTSAPPTDEQLYEEIEQMGDVARGHVEVKEIIAYDFVEKRKVIEKDKVGNEIGIKWVTIENGRAPYFCQTKEQEVIFKENNPDARIETFSVQLLKSTAIKYLDDPRNVKQFMRPVEVTPEEVAPMIPVASPAFQEEEPTWRQQAKQLGIPLNKETGGSRKKEDVLTDIVARLTQTTSTS